MNGEPEEIQFDILRPRVSAEAVTRTLGGSATRFNSMLLKAFRDCMV